MSNEFFTPQSRNEAILQNICGANNVLPEPQSRLEKLLQAILYEDETIVNFTPESRAELLLYAILTHGEYDAEPQSRNEAILQAILTDGDYDALPQSRIEALLIEWLDQTHYEEKTVSGSVVSIADAVDAPVVDLTAAIVPVQSGSGDPSPENIRPISGWTGANVMRTGKNLYYYDSTKATTATTSTATTRGIYPLGLSGCTLTFSATLAGTSQTSTYINIGKRDKASGIVTVFTGFISLDSITSRTVTFASNEEAVLMSALEDVTSITSNLPKYNIMIEFGSSVSPYEPFGEIIPVSWQTEAGTVYGGTLDVTTGTLTVTKANIASYAGETLPGAWISDRDVYAEGTTPTTGAQVVYELAMPIVYHFSPVEIRTLAGQNTIWADTGSVTVTYKAKRTAAALMMMAGRF